MEKETKNKVVVVTGGADGIGFQIAKQFLKAEAKFVIIVDIKEDLGKKAIEELDTEFGKNKTIFIKCDVTQNVQDVLENINKDYGMDILVNSAGIGVEVDPKLTIDINLSATVLWSLKFLELKDKSKGSDGGTIINLASIFGYRITSYYPVYHATKFGVIGFTRSLGHVAKYSSNGVRVIALCPGFTSTNFVNKNEDLKSIAVIKKIGESYPWQTPEAVAEETLKIFQHADSGTVWVIEGGVVTELVCEDIIP